jgi:hypothetical protein
MMMALMRSSCGFMTFTGCSSKEDFLARLDVIRRASTLMFARPEVLRWFEEAGRDIMSRVLTMVRAWKVL